MLFLIIFSAPFILFKDVLDKLSTIEEDEVKKEDEDDNIKKTIT